MTWFEEIDTASAVSDKDLMVYILNNLPKDYDVTMENLELLLNKNGDKALTVEIICDKLREKYERIKKHQLKKENKKFLKNQV